MQRMPESAARECQAARTWSELERLEGHQAWCHPNTSHAQNQVCQLLLVETPLELSCSRQAFEADMSKKAQSLHPPAQFSSKTLSVIRSHDIISYQVIISILDFPAMPCSPRFRAPFLHMDTALKCSAVAAGLRAWRPPGVSFSSIKIIKDSFHFHKLLPGWWFQPLWKIWVRQLGLLFPIYGKS